MRDNLSLRHNNQEQNAKGAYRYFPICRTFLTMNIHRNGNEKFRNDTCLTFAHTAFYNRVNHYSDVIMCVIMSQITSRTLVYSTVYSGADRRKHQSSASLAFVRGIHRWPVHSPHKWPVTRKMFRFDDVIMFSGVGERLIDSLLLAHICWLNLIELYR